MNIIDEPFAIFRSFLHHQVKRGERETILFILNNKIVDKCEEKENYLYALYTLSLLDYLCIKNNYSICSDYDEMRKKRLESPFFVGAVLKDQIKDTYIEEFKKHNIYEVTIYDAC